MVLKIDSIKNYTSNKQMSIGTYNNNNSNNNKKDILD